MTDPEVTAAHLAQARAELVCTCPDEPGLTTMGCPEHDPRFGTVIQERARVIALREALEGSQGATALFHEALQVSEAELTVMTADRDRERARADEAERAAKLNANRCNAQARTSDAYREERDALREQIAALSRECGPSCASEIAKLNAQLASARARIAELEGKKE